MKTVPLILSIIAILAAAAFGILFFTTDKKAPSQGSQEGNAAEVSANKGDIVYIQLDRILQEYDMANDLRSVVETKVQNIQAEVDRRGKKLESDVTDFQEKLNKGLMTRSVAEVQNEILEEQTVMMNQLADAIKTFLDKYNQEKQYSMILTNQGGAPVITGDTTLDITDDVLVKLNEEYVKNKNKKD